MLARLTRELPSGPFMFEPKWDGFRCLAFRDGDDIDLRSRHDRPLARYFPELVAAFRAIPETDVALDGEIVLLGQEAAFATLMSRLHPAESRVARLSRDTPASYVAFDLLGVRGVSLLSHPFAERRRRLEALLAEPRPRIRLTPATEASEVAADWFERFRGAGIDGIVAKPLNLRYEPGKRSMLKVKHERTADCVLGGIRLLPDGSVSSLLLGLYDDEGGLRHVGVVTQLPRVVREQLAVDLRPHRIALDDHPWRGGFTIGRSPLGRLPGAAARWTPEMEHDWIPLRPTLVCEVAFDQVDVDRFRHPARLRRWRPDRDAASCRLEQIEVDPVAFDDLLAIGNRSAAGATDGVGELPGAPDRADVMRHVPPRSAG